MEEDIDVAGRGFSREPAETGQFPGVKQKADAENFSDILKNWWANKKFKITDSKALFVLLNYVQFPVHNSYIRVPLS